MANELVLAGGKFNRPAHLTVFSEEPSNLKVMSSRVPTMSIQGKVFAIQADGKEMRLVKEVDGDTIALPSVPVVILGFNAARGRAYYEGTFDPKNITPPTCWSKDSVTPDEAVPEKQSARCATCPKAVKGSRISDNNKAVAACAEHRLVALIPHKALHSDMPPLRLRLPPTSDYDGQNKDAKSKDMYAFSQFVDFIRSRGVQHSYELVVKMSFDQTPGITYPKLWFQAAGWVSEKDTARIKELREEGGVDVALSTSEGEVAAQGAAAQGAAVEPERATTRTAHAGTGTAAPKATTTAPKGPTAAEKKAAAERAEAEKRKAAEAQKKAEEDRAAAAAAAAAEEGDGGIDYGALGDDGDTATTAAAGEATGDVDAKAPPAAAHVDDADVEDIMAQWSGD